MEMALKEAGVAFSDLIDKKTAAMRDDWAVAIPSGSAGRWHQCSPINTRFTTGAAYVGAVELDQRPARRRVQEDLDMVNGKHHGYSSA